AGARDSRHGRAGRAAASRTHPRMAERAGNANSMRLALCLLWVKARSYTRIGRTIHKQVSASIEASDPAILQFSLASFQQLLQLAQILGHCLLNRARDALSNRLWQRRFGPQTPFVNHFGSLRTIFKSEAHLHWEHKPLYLDGNEVIGLIFGDG